MGTCSPGVACWLSQDHSHVLTASGRRLQRKYLYQKVERTLCQPPTKNESEVQFFYVDVSTLSPVNTTYQLRVSRMDDFVLRSAGESKGPQDWPPSQALGVTVWGLFSAPQDRRAVQLQYHGSPAPGKTSLSSALQGGK